MDDSLCQQFFCTPEGPMHRRYEALRAFFVDHRLLRDIARDFGVAYGTLRNVVSAFRRQCQQRNVAPFLPILHMDDRPTAAARRHQRRRPSPTPDSSP